RMLSNNVSFGLGSIGGQDFEPGFHSLSQDFSPHFKEAGAGIGKGIMIQRANGESGDLTHGAKHSRFHGEDELPAREVYRFVPRLFSWHGSPACAPVITIDLSHGHRKNAYV